MSISDLALLKHIKDEVDFVLTNTIGKNKEEVIDNPILCRAIVRSLEIIGEASKKIDAEFKSTHPYIEWKKMSQTRDKLIHDYFGVDYDIVWEIITDKLPDLQDFISQIFDER